jgi:hypothetical protein
MAGAIVQTGYAVDDSGATSTTIAVTLTGVLAGSTLYAHVGGTDTGTQTCTVSDGSAFSAGDTKRRSTGDSQSGWTFYRENVSAGSHTITATFGSSIDFRRLRVAELSGLATSSSKDQAVGQAQATPGTGANGVSSGATSATTNANDFIIGSTQDADSADPSSGTLSAGTGYTISGTNVVMGIESKSVSATGAQTATFTQSVAGSRITHVIAFKTAGATAYTMPTSVGAFTLTGNATGLTAQRKLATAAGSYTLTGNAATFVHGYRLTTAAGSFALTSNATALSAQRKLATAAGSFVETGIAAGLTAQRRLATAAGAYTLTGVTVTLTYTPKAGAYTMQADSAAFVLNGNDVALTYTPIASAPDAAITGGGYAFFNEYDLLRRKKRQRDEERRRAEEEAESIQNAMDREIAQLLREQEAKDAERAELARIQSLADRFAGTKQPVTRRVSAALLKAHEERTRNALEQLFREIERMHEEEEMAVIHLLLAD